MKRILVAGGAGFIGSHLCRRLIELGHYVYCVDNLSTGRKENIPQHTNLVFDPWDITEPFMYSCIDEIYNCACPASPVHYQRDPVKTLETSVVGVKNLLEIARVSGANLLQCSTSEVYGDPLEHPQTEQYFGNVNCIGPRACYDEGKRAAETLCFDYTFQYGVDVKVVRIFNTYGPNMARDDGRVISNFITQALAGRFLTVYGEGKQTRSFCYVDDLVDGLIRMMNCSHYGPVNLGNPEEHTIKDVAELVLRLTRSETSITYRPLPADDPKRRKPDITLAKTLLGWQPTTNLEEGLLRTIEYFRPEETRILSRV
jgi:UDP-glucuronate decarboxylase